MIHKLSLYIEIMTFVCLLCLQQLDISNPGVFNLSLLEFSVLTFKIMIEFCILVLNFILIIESFVRVLGFSE